MLKKSVVDDIGKFDEHYPKCEDFDYTLRITRKYSLLALPVSMGIHHTVPYTNKSRMKNELKNRLAIYYGAVIRKNIDHFKGCYAHINKAGYLKGLFVLLLFATSFFYPALAIVATLLLLLDIAAGLKKRQNITFRLISHYQIPLLVIYGFIKGIDTSKKFKNKVIQVWPVV